MTDITCVFGTRPEAVKLVSVVAALRQRGLNVAVLNTGQHATLSDPGLLERMRPLDSLGLASDGSILRFVAHAEKALRARWATERPRAVLVQGDTMSAFIGAQVARELDIPVAHVEAGVRSGALREPWPEEHIRVAVDAWASWRFAPTERALANLVREGLDGVVTGNTSIDALCAAGIEARAESSPPTLLVTLHRRELKRRADALDVLQAICSYIGTQAVSAVWPVHPGMTELAAKLNAPSNLALRPPFAYDAMLRALAEARGVLTDSGGLVEEAAHLGVPTVVLRAANDRPEAVDAGIARVFSPTVAGARLAIEALALRYIPRKPTQVFGDGGAAARIADYMANALG